MLDVDVCGPSIPLVMGLEGEQVHQSGSGWSPVVCKNIWYVNSVKNNSVVGSLSVSRSLFQEGRPLRLVAF